MDLIFYFALMAIVIWIGNRQLRAIHREWKRTRFDDTEAEEWIKGGS
jgi:hypothetical protein